MILDVFNHYGHHYNQARQPRPQQVRVCTTTPSSSTSSSPSSNVPLRCPICPIAEPCVWRYNLAHHMRAKHPTISLKLYEPLWQLTNTERQLLKEIGENRHKERKMRKSRKNQSSSLIIYALRPPKTAVAAVADARDGSCLEP